ncbi:MAG TPA: DASS family sodium-coupled anion symporter [Acidobacteriota bacterium]|nr:DASS family sodium-coupled anion symporter [Acidobacteriota bacterium]
MTGVETKRLWRALSVLGLSVLLWFLPPPGTLTPAAMHLVAIFAGTIAGLVLQPFPQGAVVLMGVSLAAVSGTIPPAEILTGYSDATVWLIVSAYLLARGFIITGLGRRIAFLTVRTFGGSTLGLGYALTIADAVIAPATPSNTARAGGILFPIVHSLASCLDSGLRPNSRKAGAFLMFNQFQVNLVTSAMFLTAVAPNVLIAKLAHETFGRPISWIEWSLMAVVPGVLSLVLVPLVLYRFLLPEIKRSEMAPGLARAELEKMGPMSVGESRLLLVFLATLVSWATAQWTGLNATAVAMTGVSALLVLRVITWQDVLAEKGAWDALVWFGGLVTLASGLARLGVIGQLSTALRTTLGGVHPWQLGFVLLVLAYFYSHYFIASMTAHATALFVPLCMVAVTLGAPVSLATVVLGFMNSLNAGTTTYGTGPSPIYFGAGYLDQATWWRLGFITSMVNLVIWLVVGGVWWKFLGLW